MNTNSNSVIGGDAYDEPWQALAGWFLGPRAENRQNLNDLVKDALDWHADCRESYYPTDPCYFTDDLLHSNAAKSEIEDLRSQMKIMHNSLENSVPFFSTRYQGHMTWDVTLPSLLGYISGILWNQNNVDSTASPVTTQFEVEVGNQLCDLMRFDREGDFEPWGHLTGCGSVANIEAMWAARNLKFHPIALQGCVSDKNFPKLAIGKKTEVYIPKLGATKPLGDCTQWELLNLNIDTVCSLTAEVKATLGDDAAQLDTALESNSIVQLGFGEFIIKHKLKKLPIVCSPGTNHYSWPKAATLLGIGDKHVIPINVDGKARQNIQQLIERLDKCLADETPVYMVVAVIGSTEESAIDPLDEIIELREKYALKGLNFSIHADSAWGGYMNTMTHEPTTKRRQKRKDIGQDFVPIVPLSEFALRQYNSMSLADTVTIDPHKAGLCPYPAGALLYRNGTMKGFITLAAPEVFHNPDDLNVGVYGLEGSKPGAAACGVLLSHRVIGLDQLGYGRILGQCQLGSKLYYCMWAVVAFPEDPFTCVNFIDFPFDNSEFQDKFKTEDEVKEFIKKRILGVTNATLAQDEEAMKFLGTVGPDALINSFTINVPGNTDVKVVNDLQSLVFNELNVSPGQEKKRVPLFLTTSVLAHKNYGEALDQLKRRVGVPDYTVDGNTDEMGFLRNTCLEPYQSSGAYVTTAGELFKNTVMNCVGALDSETYGDPAGMFTFVIVNRPTIEGRMLYLDLVPSFPKKQRQYHVILTMSINESAVVKLQKLMDANTNETFFLRTTTKMKLYTFLRTLDEENNKHKMVVTKGNPESLDVLSSVNASVKEVFRFNHLPVQAYAEYPKNQTYFLYGDENNAYMSHVITKKNDFHQVVRLDERPHSITTQLLDLGLIVTIPDIEGSPQVVDGKIIDPLGQPSYTIDYRGVQYYERKTTIKMYSPSAKVWFDSQYINTVEN